MTNRNSILLSSAIVAASMFASPSFAQTAPAAATASAPLAVGAVIKDTAGGEVGTVTAVSGDNITVKTDTRQATLPRASFAATPTGYIIAMTREQLNAAVDKSLAEAGPVLSVGATVHDTAGGVVGTVEKFDAQYATVKLTNSSVQLPVTAFARGPNGPIISATAAQLEAEAAAAAAAQGAATQPSTGK
jgi:preprotein translocase subunit YajC